MTTLITTLHKQPTNNDDTNVIIKSFIIMAGAEVEPEAKRAKTEAEPEAKPKTVMRKVGFCGADDSVSPRALGVIFNSYPFVEFGVLFRPDKVR